MKFWEERNKQKKNKKIPSQVLLRVVVGVEGAGKDAQGAVKVKIAVVVHRPQKRSVLCNSCPPHTPASFQWERERAGI